VKSKQYLQSVLHKGAAVIAIQALGLAFAYLTNILVARTAGPYEYGVFTFAWTSMNVLALIAPMGLNNAVLRLIPEYQAQQRFRVLKGLLDWANPLVFAFGCVWAAVGICVVAVAGDTPYLQEAYINPLATALLVTPFFATMSLNVGIGRALGHPLTAFLPRFFLLPASLLLAAILYMNNIGRPTASFILAIILATSVVTVLGQILVLRRAFPRASRTTEGEVQLRDWMRLAVPMVIGIGANAILNNAHFIIVGLLEDPATAGVFQAAARTTALVSIPLFAANAFAAPEIARLYAKASYAELSFLVVSITRIVFWPCATAMMALILFGDWILAIFGNNFTDGHTALAILAVGQIVNVGTGVVATLLAMTGHHSDSARVFILCAVAQIVLLIALIPSFGIVGASVSTTATTVTCNILLTVIVKRRLHLEAHAFARGPHKAQPSPPKNGRLMIK
jgi:O-antigen/teichoic acid export membrane protein